MRPSQSKQLIKTKTCQRSTNPNHKKNHRNSHRKTKEHNKKKSRNSQYISIFSLKEINKTNSRKFCHETSYLFRFGFWKIHGSSIGLCHCRNNKKNSNRLLCSKQRNSALCTNYFLKINSSQSKNYTLKYLTLTNRITNHLCC